PSAASRILATASRGAGYVKIELHTEGLRINSFPKMYAALALPRACPPEIGLHFSLMSVRHRPPEESAADRRLVTNSERGRSDRLAAVLERVQREVKDGAGEQRPLDWVRRHARVEELLDVPGERIEESRPRRLGKIEIK